MLSAVPQDFGNQDFSDIFSGNVTNLQKVKKMQKKNAKKSVEKTLRNFGCFYRK
jgi:hypothetical protein